MRRMRHVVYDVSDVATWASWASVGLVWALAAMRQREPVKRRSGSDTASRAGAAAGLVIAGTPHSIWRVVTVGWPLMRVAGVPVLVCATAGTIWARIALGRMWSSGAVARAHHALRTTGPYGLSRHPIYTGILGMAAATAPTQGLGRWGALAGGGPKRFPVENPPPGGAPDAAVP